MTNNGKHQNQDEQDEVDFLITIPSITTIPTPDIAEMLNCEPTGEAVNAAIAALNEAEYQAFTEKIFGLLLSNADIQPGAFDDESNEEG